MLGLTSGEPELMQETTDTKADLNMAEISTAHHTNQIIFAARHG